MCAKYRIRSYAKPAAANPGEPWRSAAAANPVLCAEHIAFPLGKVARCGAARTVTDEVRPPAAGVTAIRTFANPVLCAGAPSAPSEGL